MSKLTRVGLALLVVGLLTPACSHFDGSISIGEVSEIYYPQSSFIYPHHYVRSTNADGRMYLRAYANIAGQEVSFGNDQGTSNLESASDRYIAWTFQALQEDYRSPLKSGLYVNVLESGQTVMVAPGKNTGQAEVKGDWILYATWEEQPTPVPWSPSTQVKYTYRLAAYNIVTSENTLLTENIPAIAGRMLRSFYALNSSHAGWIEYDASTLHFSIKLRNLADGQTRTLPVEPAHPLFISLSNDLVVWRDGNWYGYVIESDTLFIIPDVPVELDRASATLVVTAVEGGLLWRVQVGGVTRYYSAPVVVR